MAGFLLRRIAQSVFVVLVVTLLVSWAVRLTGDPTLMLVQGAGSVTEQDLENIRKAMTGLGIVEPQVQSFGTVRDDDPQLNVRGVETDRQPMRILVDSRLETRPTARLFDREQAGPVLVACAIQSAERKAALEARGAEVLCLPDARGKVDLEQLTLELGRRGMSEIHIEAGTRLNGSLLQAGVVDELLVYIGASIIGDRGLGMFNLPELQSMQDKILIEFADCTRIGPDLRVRARVRPGQQPVTE